MTAQGAAVVTAYLVYVGVQIALARKQDLKEVDEAARKAGGLSKGQRELLHRLLPQLKDKNGKVDKNKLAREAKNIKRNFSNK